MGMYSLHYNRPALFTAIARKNGVRILYLDKKFFETKKYTIEGLDIALYQMEENVNKNCCGFPVCDFKTYEKHSLSAKQKV